MQKPRLKRSKEKIGLIFFMGILFFVSGTHAQSATYATKTRTDPLDNISAQIGNSDKERFKFLVEAFCKETRINQPSNFSTNTMQYRAKDSLFMYILCTAIKENDRGTYHMIDGFSTDPKTSYFLYKKNSEGDDYNVLQKEIGTAILSNLEKPLYNETEDFLQDLFDNLINSYTSIYQARIYGVGGDPKEENTNIINGIGKAYLPNGMDTKDPYIQICGNEKTYSFPKTCKKIEQYVTAAKNMLNNSDNVLNPETIYAKYLKDNPSDGKKPNQCDTKNSKYDILSCGLYSRSLPNFVNLVYNELLFYSLFSSYYKYALTLQPNFKNDPDDGLADKITTQNEKINTIDNNIAISRKSIQISIKLLKNLQTTFPLHIGFLLYSESIYNFVGSFSKVLTPIYTLADLFKNVQSKE